MIDIKGHKVAVLCHDTELVDVATEMLNIYLADTPRTLLFARHEIVPVELASKFGRTVTGDVWFLIDDTVLVLISIVRNNIAWMSIPSVIWNLEDQSINV